MTISTKPGGKYRLYRRTGCREIERIVKIEKIKRTLKGDFENTRKWDDLVKIKLK
jgi:hypothetical protein